MARCKDSNALALLRYSVIAPLINGTSTARSNNVFYVEQSMKEWRLPDGTVLTFSAATAQNWYYAYRKKGLDGLRYAQRSDMGKNRKLTDEAKRRMEELISEFPRINSRVIRSKLITEGFISQDGVSYSTINRVTNILRDRMKDAGSEKTYLRYEARHINDIWCADTSFGLRLYGKDGKSRKLAIIGIIDDASRMIVSCRIHDSDNIPSYLSTLSDAVRRHGIPKVLNVDNGSNYRSQAARTVCANLGISVHYDPVHTPQSKAKIERFFRTLKDSWMAGIDFRSFRSVADFQRSLDEWISEYNNRIHSSLGGKTPAERYLEESKNAIHRSEAEIEKAFMLEDVRKSTFDSLIVLDDVQYQLPARFADRKVRIVYSFDRTKVFVKDDEGTLTEVHVLDKVANSKRQRYQMGKEENE